nr:nuclear export mediator factor NEMF [Tanacetum cinerariifolium]
MDESQKRRNRKKSVEIAKNVCIFVPKRCYNCKKEGHLAKDCVERADEAGQQRTNGRRGDDDTLNDADKIAIEEDDIKKISEDEKVTLTHVDYLTGNPLPNDILTLMPVCAPYTALQSYQYSQDNPWNNKERKSYSLHLFRILINKQPLALCIVEALDYRSTEELLDHNDLVHGGVAPEVEETKAEEVEVVALEAYVEEVDVVAPEAEEEINDEVD